MPLNQIFYQLIFRPFVLKVLANGRGYTLPSYPLPSFLVVLLALSTVIISLVTASGNTILVIYPNVLRHKNFNLNIAKSLEARSVDKCRH